ncbi:gtpase-activating rap/ran-gap domain-like protein [Anaeramoeba flamelloides]|uniref:Gtpase-activating rap/ran-gap domain-like protein n=1 Tax=Anaeramoeba flamelloides TaxID=1746091 RepID=A0AAV7Z4C3_9EUKA|nr:gtpase-activating rap/ran-gap domain-like protein [Anaeramoeba flamelloides]
MNELENVLNNELRGLQDESDEISSFEEEIKKKNKKKSKKQKKKKSKEQKKSKISKKSKELVLFEKCENWIFEEFDENTDPQNFKAINDISDFRDNFSSADSFHFATYHSKRGYSVFSVLDLDNEEEELLVMCNSAEDCETKTIKISDLEKTFSRTITCRGPGIKSIVRAFDSSFSSFKAVNCSQHQAEQELLDMEQFYNINQFKFGVLYIEEGQTKEQEYLSNTEPSKEFLEFLDLLGEEIELEGWSRYKGGLDTKRGTCGEKSYFTEWNSFEIMFHVSTCFPYEENDDQQVNRKRHIGNDVTIIVYLEPGATFNPEGFASMQSHVIIAVQPLPNKKNQYRMEASVRKCVGLTEPKLPNPPIFNKEDLRDFLFTKACQGERKASQSGQFFQRMVTYRKSTLERLYKKIEK